MKLNENEYTVTNDTVVLEKDLKANHNNIKIILKI